MLSKKLAAIAAVSLITASSAAVAQSASSQANTPTVQRAGTDLQGESDLDRRGIGIYIIGAVVIALLIWGAIELLDDGPDSP